MVAKVRALVCLLAVFLPLVVKGGGPEPFDVVVWVCSTGDQGHCSGSEPYVEVSIYSSDSNDPLFEGFTSGTGFLALGLFADLQHGVWIRVKRDRIDGALERTLPPVRSYDVVIAPRAELVCYVEYAARDPKINEIRCWANDRE